MSELAYRVDSASAEQLEAVLRRCDAAFVPPLSSRVDLSAYARKIVAHALRLEAWHGGEPVALLAAYCNDTASGTAFITSVSVAPGFERRGIAGRLLAACCERARAAGMREVALEVDAANTAALGLYHKHGFRRLGATGSTVRMNLHLDTEDHNE